MLVATLQVPIAFMNVGFRERWLSPSPLTYLKASVCWIATSRPAPLRKLTSPSPYIAVSIVVPNAEGLVSFYGTIQHMQDTTAAVVINAIHLLDFLSQQPSA
jgi:hypothetical protein